MQIDQQLLTFYTNSSKLSQESQIN